jgi:hypothetical protein
MSEAITAQCSAPPSEPSARITADTVYAFAPWPIRTLVSPISSSIADIGTSARQAVLAVEASAATPPSPARTDRQPLQWQVLHGMGESAATIFRAVERGWVILQDVRGKPLDRKASFTDEGRRPARKGR